MNMDRQKLEELGGELRAIGHKRRQLAEQIFQEVKDGDNHTSRQLYEQLSEISDQAIAIITEQKEMFDQEVQRL